MTRQTASIKYVNTVIRVAALIMLCIYFVSFCQYAFSLLRYPFDWDPGEGDKVYYAQRIAHGEVIYKDNMSYPFLGNCYPPLYPCIMAGLSHYVGGGPFAGRVLSLVAALLTAGLIFTVVRWRTSSWYAGMFMALSLFAMTGLSRWFALVKTDSLYVMFSVGCMASLWYYGKTRAGRFLIVGGICLLAAVYTKQLAFFVGLAACVYLFMIDKKAGIFFTCIVAGCALAIFLYLQHMTGGWFFRNIIIDNIGHPFIVGRVFRFLGQFLAGTFLIVPLACLQCAKPMRSEDRIWIVYLCAAVPVAWCMGKQGAGDYYCLMLYTAALILCGFYLGDILRHQNKNSETLSAMVLSGVLLGAQLNVFFVQQGHLKQPVQADYEAGEYLRRELAACNGPVLMDRFTCLTTALDKNDHFIEPYILRVMPPEKWGRSRLVDDIKRQYFDRIFVFADSNMPSEALAMMREYYRLCGGVEVGTFERRRVLQVLQPQVLYE